MQEISFMNNPGLIDNSYMPGINIQDISNIPGRDFYMLINEHINKANEKDISINQKNKNETNISVKQKDNAENTQERKTAEKTDKNNAESVKKEATNNDKDAEVKNNKEDSKNVRNYQKIIKKNKIQDDEP